MIKYINSNMSGKLTIPQISEEIKTAMCEITKNDIYYRQNEIYRLYKSLYDYIEIIDGVISNLYQLGHETKGYGLYSDKKFDETKIELIKKMKIYDQEELVKFKIEGRYSCEPCGPYSEMGKLTHYISWKKDYEACIKMFKDIENDLSEKVKKVEKLKTNR